MAAPHDIPINRRDLLLVGVGATVSTQIAAQPTTPEPALDMCSPPRCTACNCA